MQKTSNSHVALVRRARRAFRVLGQAHPNAECELDFATPLELLMATVLSAQSTDVRVNSVTPLLFSKYPSAKDYAAADVSEIEEIIRPTGFQKQKAKSLVGIGQLLLEKFDGDVPADQDQLIQLPGVGRKTANVVLGDAFGVPGITVDTHVGRLVRRLGWTSETDPVVVEKEIEQLFARKDWTILSHRVIFHGRRVCHSRKPACGACVLQTACPSFGEGETDSLKAKKLLKFPDDESQETYLDSSES